MDVESAELDLTLLELTMCESFLDRCRKQIKFRIDDAESFGFSPNTPMNTKVREYLKDNEKEKMEAVFEFDMNNLFTKLEDLNTQRSKGVIVGLGNLRSNLIDRITLDLSKKGGKGPSTPQKKRNQSDGPSSTQLSPSGQRNSTAQGQYATKWKPADIQKIPILSKHSKEVLKFVNNDNIRLMRNEYAHESENELADHILQMFKGERLAFFEATFKYLYDLELKDARDSHKSESKILATKIEKLWEPAESHSAKHRV